MVTICDGGIRQTDTTRRVAVSYGVSRETSGVSSIEFVNVVSEYWLSVVQCSCNIRQHSHRLWISIIMPICNV